jgi:hypothetical protein
MTLPSMTPEDERKAIVAYVNHCARSYKANGEAGIARELGYVADCIERGSHHIKARGE